MSTLAQNSMVTFDKDPNTKIYKTKKMDSIQLDHVVAETNAFLDNDKELFKMYQEATSMNHVCISPSGTGQTKILF